jgi:hypothetical protein
MPTRKLGDSLVVLPSATCLIFLSCLVLAPFVPIPVDRAVAYVNLGC